MHMYILHHHQFTVRLVNGPTQYEGRVEVYYNGEWGTVCDHGWDLNDAQIVCNELGLGHAIFAAHNAFYGQGDGQIWFRNVECVGTESTIGNCSHMPIQWEPFYFCDHSKDAGVKCVSGNVSLLYMYLCILMYFITYICMYLPMYDQVYPSCSVLISRYIYNVHIKTIVVCF